jgi:hypothetical protein
MFSLPNNQALTPTQAVATQWTASIETSPQYMAQHGSADAFAPNETSLTRELDRPTRD